MSEPELVVDKHGRRPNRAVEWRWAVGYKKRGTIGRLVMQEAQLHHLTPDCQKAVKKLREKRNLSKVIWVVLHSEVDPDYQGQGYGRRLYLEAAKQVARSRGVLVPHVGVDHEHAMTSDEAYAVYDALEHDGVIEGTGCAYFTLPGRQAGARCAKVM